MKNPRRRNRRRGRNRACSKARRQRSSDTAMNRNSPPEWTSSSTVRRRPYTRLIQSSIHQSTSLGG